MSDGSIERSTLRPIPSNYTWWDGFRDFHAFDTKVADLGIRITSKVLEMEQTIADERPSRIILRTHYDLIRVSDE